MLMAVLVSEIPYIWAGGQNQSYNQYSHGYWRFYTHILSVNNGSGGGDDDDDDIVFTSSIGPVAH